MVQTYIVSVYPPPVVATKDILFLACLCVQMYVIEYRCIIVLLLVA